MWLITVLGGAKSAKNLILLLSFSRPPSVSSGLHFENLEGLRPHPAMLMYRVSLASIGRSSSLTLLDTDGMVWQWSIRGHDSCVATRYIL